MEGEETLRSIAAIPTVTDGETGLESPEEQVYITGVTVETGPAAPPPPEPEPSAAAPQESGAPQEGSPDAAGGEDG